MPTNLENLQAAKMLLISRIKELYASPRPSYSIEGQSVSWGELRKSLMEELQLLNQQIAYEARHEPGAGPTAVEHPTDWRDGRERSPYVDADYPPNPFSFGSDG